VIAGIAQIVGRGVEAVRAGHESSGFQAIHPDIEGAAT
jgi:hypothetical protein